MKNTSSLYPKHKNDPDKLLIRDAVFEKKQDDYFFSQLFDGIGSVKKVEERERMMKQQKEKRLKEMRQIKVYQQLQFSDNMQVKGDDLGERVKE